MSLTIPEVIDGRRIWLDGPMQDVIDKLHQMSSDIDQTLDSTD